MLIFLQGQVLVETIVSPTNKHYVIYGGNNSSITVRILSTGKDTKTTPGCEMLLRSNTGEYICLIGPSFISCENSGLEYKYLLHNGLKNTTITYIPSVNQNAVVAHHNNGKIYISPISVSSSIEDCELSCNITMNNEQFVLSKKFTSYKIFSKSNKYDVQLHFRQEKNEEEKFKVSFQVAPSCLENNAVYAYNTSSSNLYSMTFNPSSDEEREFYPTGGTAPSNTLGEAINCTFNNSSAGLAVTEKQYIKILKPTKILKNPNNDYYPFLSGSAKPTVVTQWEIKDQYGDLIEARTIREVVEPSSILLTTGSANNSSTYSDTWQAPLWNYNCTTEQWIYINGFNIKHHSFIFDSVNRTTAIVTPLAENDQTRYVNY